MNRKKVAQKAAILLSCLCLGTGMLLPQNHAVSYQITANAETNEWGEEYTEGTYGVLTYHEYEDRIVISGCDDKAETVEVPANINGKEVTEIAEEAFYGCAVKEVTLPDTLSTIGFRAFGCCENLTKIDIPLWVGYLGAQSFYMCKNLETVTLPEGLLFLGTDAFAYTSLKSINIPTTINIFGVDIFESTPWLTEQREKKSSGDF